MTKATGTTEYVQSEEILNNEEFGKQLLKMGIGLNNLADISPWRLGDIRQSILTEDEFQERTGDNWVVMTGQDISGSDLHASYSISTLPDLVTDGRFLAQASGAESIFDLLSSQNKDHSHNILSSSANTGTIDSGELYMSVFGESGNSTQKHVSAAADYNTWNYRSGNDGGTDAHPTTLRVNFFIKINNEPTNF